MDEIPLFSVDMICDITSHKILFRVKFISPALYFISLLFFLASLCVNDTV